MKSALKKLFLSLMMLVLPVASIGCDIDDDFFEDGYLTEAIYATGDAISQIIVVSGAVWGPCCSEPYPQPYGH